MPVYKQLKQYKLLLDTHIWIWAMMGSEKLNQHFQESLKQNVKKENIFISAISIWELGMLVERKRVELEMDCLDWVEQAFEHSHLNLIPLTPSIAIQSSRLPENPHGDPADRILMATAHEYHAVLVTHDQKILEYGNGEFINVYDPCI